MHYFYLKNFNFFIKFCFLFLQLKATFRFYFFQIAQTFFVIFIYFLLKFIQISYWFLTFLTNIFKYYIWYFPLFLAFYVYNFALKIPCLIISISSAFLKWFYTIFLFLYPIILHILKLWNQEFIAIFFYKILFYKIHSFYFTFSI